MTPPIAPPKKQDPRQTIQPGDSIHTATTLPQQDAVRDPRREPESGAVFDSGRGLDAPPKTIADLDERNAMRLSNFMGALREDLRKRDARIEGKIDDVAGEVADLRNDQRRDRDRIARLEADRAPPRPLAKSLHEIENEDELASINGVLSTDERQERLEKHAVNSRKRQKRRTVTGWSVGVVSVIAAVGTVIGAVDHLMATYADTAARAARQGAAEAVKDTAPALEKAVKEAQEKP